MICLMWFFFFFMVFSTLVFGWGFMQLVLQQKKKIEL